MKTTSRSGATRLLAIVGVISVAAIAAGVITHTSASAESSKPHSTTTIVADTTDWTSATTSAVATDPSSVTTVPVTTLPVTTVPGASPDLVVANVNAFYGHYTKLSSNDGTKALISKYVASPYGATLNGPNVDYDQVMCAQDFPQSYTVSSPTISGNKVQVTVHESWTYGKNDVAITGDADSGLITDIACPAGE